MNVIEPEVGQRHEDVERKREYYNVIFPERTCNFTPRKRGQVKTMVVEHFNGILFHKSRPANKQQAAITHIWN
jgi:hypothetical protein